jgi:hypothetical protein
MIVYVTRVALPSRASGQALCHSSPQLPQLRSAFQVLIRNLLDLLVNLQCQQFLPVAFVRVSKF